MASVLQTIVEKKHYKFVDRLDSWQQGVELSTQSLVADGSVDADYYKQIVSCIEKYGPYVVFDHYVAMPHSQENATGVHKTGIGFMRVKEAVSFGKDEDGVARYACTRSITAIQGMSTRPPIRNRTALMVKGPT